MPQASLRLIMLGCEFDVHEPPALIDHPAAVAARG